LKARVLLFFVLAVWAAAPSHAHVGSPDVFYEGKVGPWPARITIRMPAVVPGLAEIVAQVQSREPVSVTFTPLSSRVALSNAPPPEIAQPVRGETNLYTGELWLMTMGAYSIEVRVKGESGKGEVQIPVNSVAIAQLPLPPWLGEMLLVLGLVLFCGGMAIVASAAGESTLSPGVLPGETERRKYWTGALVTGVVLSLALVGGKKWWEVDEKDFRSRLRSGGWPELAADVRAEGSQRILRLVLGKTALGSGSPQQSLALAPDHGKLLHLFLVGLPNHQSFGHIHPVRRDESTFEVPLPRLPEGDYDLFCDLTLESGLSSTATNRIRIPASPGNSATPGGTYLEPDPDDSWAGDSTVAVRESPGGDTICRLPDGTQVSWKAHPALRAKQDAGLRFEIRNPAGQIADLQPYMGMMSHAAVLRADGRVFAHLHPSGNYSMAAQMFFDAKLASETGTATSDGAMAAGMDHSKMDHAMMGHAPHQDPSEAQSRVISLPYEFPTPGEYRVWLQFKTDGRILTAIFDATVG